MSEKICIVGLDEPDYQVFKNRFKQKLMLHETLPKIRVENQTLLVQPENRMNVEPVAGLIFHGIFEHDLEFLAALALWGGPCLPNAKAMMDCRLRLPCLVRALEYTAFGKPHRGYASARLTLENMKKSVAKWGNWHCGENKICFSGTWTAEEPSLIEPFIEGEAVRIVLMGEHYWQIQLVGKDWLKSIHDEKAHLMEPDPELVQDTIRIAKGFGLEMLGNDYIVTAKGSKHLLEVNHIPNVTRFPEIWKAYIEYVTQWIETLEARIS